MPCCGCLSIYWPEYLECICKEEIYIPVHMRPLITPILYCKKCKRTVQFGIREVAVEYRSKD
jgi:hypothetical protein